MINTTDNLTWTTLEFGNTTVISTNQTDSFNSTQNFTSYSTTTSTASPTTSVTLNNLVVLSALNENKRSRAIINPDEKFSAVKNEVYN